MLALFAALLNFQVSSHPWTIDSGCNLIWQGTPYIPVGLRVNADPSAISEAQKAGVTDFLVDVPAEGGDWSECLKRLNGGGSRYILSINSLAPHGFGYAVEPQNFRIDGADQPFDLDITIPGARSALVMLLVKRDSAIEQKVHLATPEGRIKLKIQPTTQQEHVLLVYPELDTLETPDFWEGFDKRRDEVVAALKSQPLGTGLRGILNPIGAVVKLPGPATRFVPNSPLFQLEFQNFLEQKYKTIDNIQRSWSMSSNEFATFQEFSRLVPLWNGTRGVPLIWDPVTDKTWALEVKKSLIWQDIDFVVRGASRSRYERLVNAIHNIIDVPVLQEWYGWASTYEFHPTVDGIAAVVRGATPSSLGFGCTRALSTVRRWTRPGWTPVTSIDLGPQADPTFLIQPTVDTLAQMGSRGWFFRVSGPAALQAVAAAANYGATFEKATIPTPLYYPESAENPAAPQALPGGRYWYPSPADGNRLDIGSDFAAYRISDADGSTYAIWSLGQERRVKLLTNDGKSLKFSTIDGSSPKPKVMKNGVEVTIGRSPLIITGSEDLPVPEPAVADTQAKFDRAITALLNNRTGAGEDFLFKDALSGLATNPGGSFYEMRRQYRIIQSRTSDYTWFEAEGSKNHNFGDSAPMTGVSNAKALVLTTRFIQPGKIYFAEYKAPLRAEGDQEVWIAARFPSEQIGQIRVLVNGQAVQPSGYPLSPYGLGFGWYRCGKVTLRGRDINVRVEVDGGQSVDLALDTIVVTPPGFQPNGAFQPDE